MACFIAPAAAAVVTSVIRKKVPAKYHIDWLLLMLWGGVLMLVVDHIASGEVVLHFPFFTAGWEKIWPEVLSVGLQMTVVIFVVWGAMVLLANRKRHPLSSPSQ